MLSRMVSKNKYQMPNVEELVDKTGQIITSKRPGKLWFTVLDLNGTERCKARSKIILFIILILVIR